MLVILLLAFAIRVTNLGFQSFWGDEEFTVRFSSLPLLEILQEIARQGEPHPPFYYYLMHFWLLVTGKTDFAVRFSSVLPGLLSVALIYALGARLFNRYVGLIAAFFLAVNPFFVYHGQEARMYPLATMLGIISTYLFIEIIERAKVTIARSRPISNRLLMVIYVLISVAAIYVHYYTAFVILFQNVYVLLLLVIRPRLYLRWVLTGWVPAQLAIVVLFGPWILWAWGIINSYGGQGATADFITGPARLLPVFSLGWALDPDLRAKFALGYLAIFLVGLIAWLRLKKESVLIITLYLSVPVMAVVTISLQRPIFAERYLMSALPAFILILACGVYALIVAAKRSIPGVVAPFFGVVALAYVLFTASIPLQIRHAEQAFMNADFRRMAGFVADYVQPDDALIFEVGHGDVLFTYYYQGPSFSTYYQFPDMVKGFPVGTDNALAEIAGKHRRLWLVLYAAKQVDPGDVVERWLDDNTFKAYNSYFGIGRLVLYRTESGLEEGTRNVGFSNGLSLERIDLDNQVKAGDVLRVGFKWKKLRPSGNDFRVVTRLFDSKGHLATQVDRLPKDGLFPVTNWPVNQIIEDKIGLFLSPSLMPGDYRLEMSLYEPATGWKSTVTQLGKVKIERPVSVYPASTSGLKTPMSAVLGEGLTLLGANIPQGTFKPGDTLPIEIYLSADEGRATGENIGLKLKLVDEKGRVLDEGWSTMAGEIFPPSNWRDGEVIRDIADVTLGPKTESGTYRVVVSTGDGEAVLGEIKVKGRDRLLEEPALRNRVSTSFGPAIRLTGWQINEEEIKAGSKLEVNLSWKATGAINDNYDVFVHLLDSQGRVVAQHDSSPAGGTAKTAGWLEGEYILDKHEMLLGKDLPPGRYAIEIGLYRPDTGVRLKTEDGEDRLVIAEVEVR